MLSLNLAPIFNARGITKSHPFLVKNDFSNFTVSRLINNETFVFRLEYLEKLCNALACEPNDLLLFTPEKTSSMPKIIPCLTLAKMKVLATGQPPLPACR
jgi:DNA-binding Xre family transcriptional regulator